MATFGDTTAGGDEFPMADARCLVDRFNLSEDGTINSAWAYSGPSATSGASWKFVIISDSSGPSSVLHVSTGTSITTASTWFQFTGMSGTLTAGDYWLGVVGNSFQAYLGEDASGSAPDVCMANGTFDYASPPGTWPGTDVNYGVGLNVYVDYTVPSSGQPITKRLGWIPHMPRTIRRGFFRQSDFAFSASRKIFVPARLNERIAA